MNYIDIILGLLLLFAAISGFRKGLVSIDHHSRGGGIPPSPLYILPFSFH